MKKLFSLIILSLLTLLSACSSSGEISTYTIPFSSMPKNLDPQVASADSELFIISNTYDGLFEVVNNAIVNNLVEDYTISEDGKVYTLTLKDDSVYYYPYDDDTSFNNQKVVADDFVFTFQRILDKSTSSIYTKDFMNIKNAQAVYDENLPVSSLGVYSLNDTTLVIELENSDYNFISKLTLPGIVPCNEEFFEYTAGAYGLSVYDILSNGPFRVNYLSADEEAVTILRTREDFQNPIDRIRFTILNQDEFYSAYINDNISGYFAFDFLDDSLENSESIAISSSNSSLFFNLENETMANENIRQALSYYAYAHQNTQANLDIVSPAFSIFPADMIFYDDYIKNQLADVIPSYLSSNPKTLLSNGYSNLGIQNMPQITVLIPSDSEYTLIYENINQLWQEELGVFFNVELLPMAQIIQRVKNNDYTIAIGLLTPNENNPLSVISEFSSYNDEVNNLLIFSLDSSNEDIVLNNIKKAQEIIINSSYVTPIGYEYTYFYHKNYFDNIIVNPFGYIINLKYATAD